MWKEFFVVHDHDRMKTRRITNRFNKKYMKMEATTFSKSSVVEGIENYSTCERFSSKSQEKINRRNLLHNRSNWKITRETLDNLFVLLVIFSQLSIASSQPTNDFIESTTEIIKFNGRHQRSIGNPFSTLATGEQNVKTTGINLLNNVKDDISSFFSTSENNGWKNNKNIEKSSKHNNITATKNNIVSTNGSFPSETNNSQQSINLTSQNMSTSENNENISSLKNENKRTNASFNGLLGQGGHSFTNTDQNASNKNVFEKFTTNYNASSSQTEIDYSSSKDNIVKSKTQQNNKKSNSTVVNLNAGQTNGEKQTISNQGNITAIKNSLFNGSDSWGSSPVNQNNITLSKIGNSADNVQSYKDQNENEMKQIRLGVEGNINISNNVSQAPVINGTSLLTNANNNKNFFNDINGKTKAITNGINGFPENSNTNNLKNSTKFESENAKMGPNKIKNQTSTSDSSPSEQAQILKYPEGLFSSASSNISEPEGKHSTDNIAPSNSPRKNAFSSNGTNSTISTSSGEDHGKSNISSTKPSELSKGTNNLNNNKPSSLKPEDHSPSREAQSLITSSGGNTSLSTSFNNSRSKSSTGNKNFENKNSPLVASGNSAKPPNYYSTSAPVQKLPFDSRNNNTTSTSAHLTGTSNKGVELDMGDISNSTAPKYGRSQKDMVSNIDAKNSVQSEKSSGNMVHSSTSPKQTITNDNEDEYVQKLPSKFQKIDDNSKNGNGSNEASINTNLGKHITKKQSPIDILLQNQTANSPKSENQVVGGFDPLKGENAEAGEASKVTTEKVNDLLDIPYTNDISEEDDIPYTNDVNNDDKKENSEDDIFVMTESTDTGSTTIASAAKLSKNAEPKMNIVEITTLGGTTRLRTQDEKSTNFDLIDETPFLVNPKGPNENPKIENNKPTSVSMQRTTPTSIIDEPPFLIKPKKQLPVGTATAHEQKTINKNSKISSVKPEEATDPTTITEVEKNSTEEGEKECENSVTGILGSALKYGAMGGTAGAIGAALPQILNMIKDLLKKDGGDNKKEDENNAEDGGNQAATQEEPKQNFLQNEISQVEDGVINEIDDKIDDIESNVMDTIKGKLTEVEEGVLGDLKEQILHGDGNILQNAKLAFVGGKNNIFKNVKGRLLDAKDSLINDVKSSFESEIENKAESSLPKLKNSTGVKMTDELKIENFRTNIQMFFINEKAKTRRISWPSTRNDFLGKPGPAEVLDTRKEKESSSLINKEKINNDASENVQKNTVDDVPRVVTKTANVLGAFKKFMKN